MPANPNLLPVSEAAREAAWTAKPGAFSFLDKSAWMDGRYDDQRVIQAFAAFEQSKDAAFVAMLEGMKALCPDEHCHRRSPCEGLGAAYCCYSVDEKSRNAVIDQAIANARALGEGRAG